VHRGDIESTNAHFPRHVQIKLFFVQISVFSKLEVVGGWRLGDLVVVEVLTSGGSLSCLIDCTLLRLQDRLALSVGKLPDQIR